MSNQWQCQLEGRILGPLSMARLQQLASAGRLKRLDYVRPMGKEEWMPAQIVPELASAFPVTSDASETKKKPATRSVSAPQPPTTSQTAAASSVTAPAVPPSGYLRPIPLPKGTPPSPAPLVPRRKAKAPQNAQLPLLMAGGGGVVVVILLLVMMFSGFFSGGNKEEAKAKEAQKKEQKAPIVEPAPVDEEVPAEEVAPAETETEPAEKPDEAIAKAVPVEPPKVESPYASIKKWMDAPNQQPIYVGQVSVRVMSVWLARNIHGDALNERDDDPDAAEMKEPAGEEMVASEGEDEAVAKPRYLCVDLRVRNQPGKPAVEYKGWIEGAVLLDEEERVAKPLGFDRKADLPRVKQLELPGGDFVGDVLIFPIEKDAKSFRLVLPTTNLSNKVKTPHIGFQLVEKSITKKPSNRIVSLRDAGQHFTESTGIVTAAKVSDVEQEREELKNDILGPAGMPAMEKE